MQGATVKGATKARARYVRLAVWAVSVALSVGVVTLFGVLQFDGYDRMLGNARRQIVGSTTGAVRMVDQDIDASLGPCSPFATAWIPPIRARSIPISPRCRRAIRSCRHSSRSMAMAVSSPAVVPVCR